MKNSSCLNRPLQYYCTAGKGMEKFVAAELQSKLAANDIDHVTGKVFFTTCADIEKVRGLKSAERLFLLLRRAPPLAQTGTTGKCEDVVRDQIIGQRQLWTERLAQWQRLRRTLEETEPEQTGPGRGRKRKLALGAGDGERPACGQPDHDLVEEKQEHEDVRGQPGVEGRGPAEMRRGPGLEGCVFGVAGQDSDLQGRDSRGVETARTGVSRVEVPPSSESSSEEGGVGEARSAPVSFRVCCRCSGSVARIFSFQDPGGIIGRAISRQLGWSVNLREPDLEVNVHLSDDHSVLGLPLLRLPLAHRSYIKTTGLRSTVAWAMTSLADIKPGCFVLDPMCGVGTILLEAAKEYPSSFFLGMDIDESQLEKARDNVQFAKLTGRVEVIRSSVMAIPLPSNSVDAVVCDIPFGRKFGSKSDMAARLPAIVTEMERVLRVGGTLVLLLSPALVADMKKSCCPRPASLPARTGQPPPSPPQRGPGGAPSLLFSSLEFQGVHRVSLGTTDALIHTYGKGGGVV